ncbi:hypothetical protein CEXT_456741 [Caerostris extrusa]|uniref:Uncharacterized protein n=1 Tax=Caerostris extrusa TaxID=172846 RepID=A0AAV4UL43_CAEEX|nr:hypothetical protein CEXT_456741 [Caerostris extrusa]
MRLPKRGCILLKSQNKKKRIYQKKVPNTHSKQTIGRRSSENLFSPGTTTWGGKECSDTFRQGSGRISPSFVFVGS